jgi:hypothetical protein
MPTIKLLAQKDYNKQFLRLAANELKILEKWNLKYKQKHAEDAYTDLPIEKKSLIEPYILPDDLFAREWQSRKFKPNPYKPEKRIYATRRGELVRSKSEAIIADMLYEMGIPYHYELPVRMWDGSLKYPDFSLLKVRTREVIYLEHLGRMDEEKYRKDTMEKMDIYRASGIYTGKNLILTFEGEHNPLDISGIREMLKEIFL